MQPNTYTNEVFSSTSTRFNPYFSWCCHLYVLHCTYQPKQGLNLADVLENASFVHVFGCMCMFELTVTGWWIIVAQLSIPNWFELHGQLLTFILFIEIPTSFSKFKSFVQLVFKTEFKKKQGLIQKQEAVLRSDIAIKFNSYSQQIILPVYQKQRLNL